MNAFQDHYPENVAHCYGCGRLNKNGHQIKTEWDGDETVTHYTPQPYEMSVPGFVYGGLIASLIDCHSTGTAAAAMYRQEGRDLDTLPAFRFVTGSLHVDYAVGGDVTLGHYVGKSETQLRAGWQTVADFIETASAKVPQVAQVVPAHSAELKGRARRVVTKPRAVSSQRASRNSSGQAATRPAP
jgi:hypothetical protein